MANKSVVMASSLTGEAFESLYVDFSDSDSDSWLVIDPSDSDDDNLSYGDVTTTTTDDDDDDEDEDEDDVVVPDVDDLIQHPFGSLSSDVSMQSVVNEITLHQQEVKFAHEIDHIRQIMDDGDSINGEDAYESDEDDDDLDLELDDELVPKWLNNKFGRQRMRKLGKRANPKMKRSKRLVCMYNKPGCVHGKHGLGMKHNLMI